MNATLSDLRILKDYILHHGGERIVRRIKARVDSAAERVNLDDPRAFAFTMPGHDTLIRYAPALDDLMRNYRVGILLHEIGHIVLGEANRDADEDEVDVDAWILRNYPESNYCYKTTAYMRHGYGEPELLQAREIEWVSSGFLAAIDGRA